MIMAIDEHELLFRIFIRRLFSLWAVCLHDLDVKIDASQEIYLS